MKKIFLFALAICLAMPAISYAGSATSRWDLSIGGTVKMTMGWSDYAAGDQSASGTAPRGDYSGFSTANNKYGNWIWGAGETGLTFAVRGPDALGAKTSAFISTDFVGTWGGSTYGTLDLVVANMTFDWANTSVTAGMAGGPWGMFPVFAGMGWSDWGFGGKGPAPVNPGIHLTQRLTKEFSLKVGVTSQNDANSAPNALGSGAPTSYMKGNWPLVYANLTYSSGACGKVGPWQLTFKATGIFEQERKIYNNTATTVSDQDLNVYYTDFAVLVPIIPEKNGDKTGAWYVDGVIYTSQDFGGAGYLGGFGAASSYTRSLGEFGAPHSWGYLGHTQFYFTDAFSVNLAYYIGKNAVSNPYKVLNPNTVDEEYSYLAQVQYQVNPAVKLQVLWNQNHSRYFGASSTAGLKKTGTTNVWRFSAFYYF